MTHDSPVKIMVDLSNMRAHIYNISISMSNAGVKQKFMLPSWTPGSYLMREFAQHIIAIKAYEKNQEINIIKINKNTFEINNTSCCVELKYEVYGFDSSIRAAYIDDSQAFFNGSSLFLCPENKEEERYVLLVQNPKSINTQDWQVATAMPALDIDEKGFGSYEARSYAELIDYPFQISAMKRLEFKALDTPHEIVLVGDVRPFDEKRLVGDLSNICESQINLFGQKAPFKNYLFIARFEEGGHGGLEHRNSTMLLATPYALPALGLGEPDTQYRSFLSLCSHEYFHAWNIKRLMPKNFVKLNLNQECYTTMLWLFEGITSYYDDYILRKAGLISFESYLDILQKNYSRLLKNKGRNIQSLAQSSFDAWIKFYRPNENTQNATVSYYLKGAFIGLLLDLMIRINTKQEKSLDDLMLLAFEKFGSRSSGINEEEFFALAHDFIDIQEFKNKFIYGTADLPLEKYLSFFGVDLVKFPDEQTIDDKTRLPAYWGFKLRFDDLHRAIITYVDKDGPAMLAGVSPFDELIAVNNIRLDSSNFSDILNIFKPDMQAELLIARKKILRTYIISVGHLPLSTCKISLRQETSMAEKALRISWLKN